MSVNHNLLPITDDELASLLTTPEAIRDLVNRQERKVRTLGKDGLAIVALTASSEQDPLYFLVAGDTATHVPLATDESPSCDHRACAETMPLKESSTSVNPPEGNQSMSILKSVSAGLLRHWWAPALVAGATCAGACHHQHDYDDNRDRVVVVDEHGYRHEGYYGPDRHWHGGWYDEHSAYHDDPYDWRR